MREKYVAPASRKKKRKTYLPIFFPEERSFCFKWNFQLADVQKWSVPTFNAFRGFKSYDQNDSLASNCKSSTMIESEPDYSSAEPSSAYLNWDQGDRDFWSIYQHSGIWLKNVATITYCVSSFN